MMLRVVSVCLVAGYSLLSAATVDTLSGTVKDGSGAAIKGAVVSLAKKAVKDTTDETGAFQFEIPNTGTIVPFGMAIDNTPKFGIQGKQLQFSIGTACKSASVSIFNCNGRMISTFKMGNLKAGVQKQVLPELSSGFYVIQVALDGYKATLNLVSTGSDMYLDDAQTGTSSKMVTSTAAAAAIDTLVAAMSGYTTAKVEVDSYAKKGVAITLVKEVVGPVTCNLPDLPASSALTKENPKLPDPFTFYDGTKLTKKSQWECRRQEILAMAEKYVYGPCPPKPDEVTGTVGSDGTITINCKQGTKTATFSAKIAGSGTAICLKLSGGIYPSNAKTLTIGSGNASKIQTLYGVTGMIENLANAWMIDRVMDVLELNPDCGHDPTKIMVSGCSGCGKGAFLAGVFSRVPLTVIVESGGGGAANFRQAEWFRHGGAPYSCTDAKPQSIDNLEDNGICGPWVSSVAQWLRSSPAKVKLLPYDQHLLLACIAPRYLCHLTNQHGPNEWCHLGGTCEALSSWAAEPVFNALGIPEHMGFLMYTESSAPGHCSNPSSATALANEFFKRVFNGDTTAKTDVMTMKDADLQQPQGDWKEMWVDWDMDTKLE